jgi:adenylate kinase
VDEPESAEPLVLVLLGAPGAGKGTLCKALVAKYATPQISTGDLFRAAAEEGREAGLRAKGYMDSGHLVPDKMVIEQVRDRIQAEDCRSGFILDGFPRTVCQAEALMELLAGRNFGLTVVVGIEVEKETIVKRLTGRRLCRSCRQGTFNNYSMPPKEDGICDYCGGELYQRTDDRESVILNRLKVDEEQRQSVIDYYQRQGLFASLSEQELKMSGMAAKLFQLIEQWAMKRQSRYRYQGGQEDSIRF